MACSVISRDAPENATTPTSVSRSCTPMAPPAGSLVSFHATRNPLNCSGVEACFDKYEGRVPPSLLCRFFVDRFTRKPSTKTCHRSKTPCTITAIRGGLRVTANMVGSKKAWSYHENKPQRRDCVRRQDIRVRDRMRVAELCLSPARGQRVDQRLRGKSRSSGSLEPAEVGNVVQGLFMEVGQYD